MPARVLSMVRSSPVALLPSATRLLSEVGVDTVSCVPVAEV